MTLLVVLAAVLIGVAGVARADDWPQWLGPKRDGVWRETGILERFPEKGPKVVWRVDIGAGYSGPAVAGGRVYVTDRKLSKGARNPDNPFQRGSIAGTERVLCLSEANGEELWSHEYDCPYTVSYPSGPRATPVVAAGRVYTLGAEGHLFCFDAESGKIIWKRELRKDFDIETPLWGFSAHPLLDGDRLICLVGGQGSTVVAFHRETGKELWRALSASQPGYCPPVIIEAGGTRQLVVWHPDALESVDPATGKVYWTEPFSVKSGLSIPMPRLAGGRLFVTSFYDGPLMMELGKSQPTAKVAWRGTGRNEKRTQQLHAIMCTPFIDGEYIYGVCSYGQLRCLKVNDGERVWETLEATGADPENTNRNRWANAFLVRNGDRYFLANEQGELIIAKLDPKGYEELSRAKLLEPTNFAMGRKVVWSHPAFANKSAYMRNDKEIIRVSLAK